MNPALKNKVDAANQFIGENVRRIRRIQGVSLDALSKTAMVSKGNLSRLENGKGNPTIETLIQIAAALKIDMGDLL